jgi:hypothetical protein
MTRRHKPKSKCTCDAGGAAGCPVHDRAVSDAVSNHIYQAGFAEGCSFAAAEGRRTLAEHMRNYEEKLARAGRKVALLKHALRLQIQAGVLTVQALND